MINITPKDIVVELDKYIIGQRDAKKLIAIALRNRWRRIRVNKNIIKEISPKNILMIGPTGVGKTEIAKRLSKLTNSPFIKVEATKFTEIGYVGKEVESIIKDLIDISFKMVKDKSIKKCKKIAKKIAEEKIINILFNNIKKINNKTIKFDEKKDIIKKIKIKLNNKLLENEYIEIKLNKYEDSLIEITSFSNYKNINSKIKSLINNSSNKKLKIYKTKIKYARKLLIEEEYNRILNIEEIKNKSIKLVEQNGIVFIDEIDKICKKNNELYNTEVSREGVQRDLLSIVEGCSVLTKYGFVKTDYILFIASGSFEKSKISDLMPEFQGRFPIITKLNKLTIKDFQKILTDTKISITRQYISLLNTEGIKVIFTRSGIKKISEISWNMNEQLIDIGARRLYFVLEKIMEKISFCDFKSNKKSFLINKKYVSNYFKFFVDKSDKEKFIL